MLGVMLGMMLGALLGVVVLVLLPTRQLQITTRRDGIRTEPLYHTTK